MFDCIDYDNFDNGTLKLCLDLSGGRLALAL